MNWTPSKTRCVIAAIALSPFVSDIAGEDASSRIVGAALVESRAHDKLAYLSDRIGHRLSGSESLQRAVAWAAAEFKRDEIPRVWTESVKVPHWVRGEEQARIVAPVHFELALLALGGSIGTPGEGITADVVVAHDFDELESLGDAVRGKIVLFNKSIEPGYGARGYSSASRLRVHGPSRAAGLGAVGMLIRSLGTADYRLPHTGALQYAEGVPRIPAAAIASEDAELIERLSAGGEPVQVHLTLGCVTLPDADSANVLAEIPGREFPDEIVLIGAHLDSWDVGQGAHDDGAGCAVVMETMRLFRKLGLAPRRTIRAVLFTNEENGLRGGRDYAKRHGDENHVAAIESDTGGERPIAFGITGGPGAVEHLRELIQPLGVIGLDQVFPTGGGADISPLKHHGVPRIGLMQALEVYFDYHHSAADTLDKIDRNDLDRNVAALALLTYRLAEQDRNLPRPPVEPAD